MKNTRNELLNKYLDTQNEILKMVFEENYSQHLRAMDLVYHLEEKQKQYGLEDNPYINSLKSDLDILSLNIGTIINGLNGEKYAYSKIRLFEDMVDVEKNIEIEVDGLRAELDFIIITPNGAVVCPEVKYRSKDLTISERGVCSGHDFAEDSSKSKSVIDQLNLHNGIIRRIVREWGGEDAVNEITIVSPLLFANKNKSVIDNSGQVDVCYLHNIEAYIKNISGSRKLTSEERKNLMSVFLKHRIEAGVYDEAVDLKAMVENARRTISIIKEKATEEAQIDKETAFNTEKKTLIQKIAGFCLLGIAGMATVAGVVAKNRSSI